MSQAPGLEPPDPTSRGPASPTAFAMRMPSAAGACARIRSPSSRQAKRTFAHLEPGALGAVGLARRGRRRARCSQPLATTFSPRKAQQSHASHTAMRAAAALSFRASVQDDRRARGRRRPRRLDPATGRQRQSSSDSGVSRTCRADSNAARASAQSPRCERLVAVHALCRSVVGHAFS